MGPTKGFWYLNSNTDSRWNSSGNSDRVGGFAMPYEAKEKLNELKKHLGDPPKDLEWGYDKD